MTYDQLLAFLAVADAGAFTAAALTLHKSQPAVSKLVRNLEDELGIELFDRGSYRATLSDAGRLFRERAAAVIEQVEGLKSFARELAGDVEPIVRLAVEAITPLASLMTILRAVGARFPAVRIELATERLTGAAAALQEERADLVIATRLGVASARVERAYLQSVRIVPVARRDHPLATCGAPIPPALLRTHAQIVLRDSAQGPDSPSLNVLEGGLRWSVTDVAAKKDIILAGMGWGGLPEHLVASELATGELVVLAVPEFEVDRMELFVMRRRDRPHGVVASALWDELKRWAAAAPASAAGKTRRAPARRRDAGARTHDRRRA
ncbi:DNA-binding transcriptional regulator, LysR family [Nannocystis exedens]|uniref:DNA-binding transcriptional regulator, LysR family n=1 Tax=Nannocystis exedens TaxID=54 RepID=A0A1I2IWR4_9BACT|nr:LysR family transcriptional regulator [Nannocystis exedens]PCC67131.1 HTH-type transcriptional regulator BenM [Nannocystis exedens]SFF44951.1 DNA-binding transcriptional regulator, LysR family [Nannocystis exedens]